MDEHALSLLSAALTPLTAVLALYIGFRQNRLQKEQLRLQLYERRAAVFRAYVEFVSRIAFAHRVTEEDAIRYRSAIVDAPFLFDAQDVKSLQEIAYGADKLPDALIDLDEIKDKEKRAEAIRFLANWRSGYYQRLKEAPGRFRKYLGVEY